ncbi:hypothetical protein UA08_02790 [Talaromyces atroroseus]|uniref:Uncharacterized protein n=1 Tax=Talaromyces atroroseus TaxID=1441469 RepID=A0A225B869_TALAT|nr:hypothetical protein UA08_02790 [Talaromyces atroroseus]OKL62137.1 hypothetical protein UA08_02790 [Talaromyces atroroseus]
MFEKAGFKNAVCPSPDNKILEINHQLAERNADHGNVPEIEDGRDSDNVRAGVSSHEGSHVADYESIDDDDDDEDDDDRDGDSETEDEGNCSFILVRDRQESESGNGPITLQQQSRAAQAREEVCPLEVPEMPETSEELEESEVPDAGRAQDKG